MTILYPCAGSLYSHLGRAAARLLTRQSTSNATFRVVATYPASNKQRPSSRAPTSNVCLSQQVRYYANGTTKTPAPRGRPKQHTGREPAKRTVRNRAAAKPKTSTAKQSASTASTRGRPRKTAVTKKPVVRTSKTRPLSKTAQKKATTQRTRALKEKALLHPPKRLPDTAWLVLNSENVHSGSVLAAQTKENGAKYRNLAPEEHERLNHTANQNKAKNEVELKKWLSSHTPEQIKEANHARDLLNKDLKAKGSKKIHYKLKDDRLVTRPTTSFIQFSKDRWASGDFKNMQTVESSKLIGKEWKALSASEKKPFEDMSRQDLNRYAEECKTVYGIDAVAAKPKRVAATAAA